MANKRSWSATSTKKSKPTVPGSTQSMLKENADKLIDDVIKPRGYQLKTGQIRSTGFACLQAELALRMS